MSFMGENQYLNKFIANFSTIASPLHIITVKGKRFHWGKTKQRSFEDLKKKISDALVLAMLNLQQPFELEIDASGYVLGEILMQAGSPV
jgi:hypothetical protein